MSTTGAGRTSLQLSCGMADFGDFAEPRAGAGRDRLVAMVPSSSLSGAVVERLLKPTRDVRRGPAGGATGTPPLQEVPARTTS
ncbi:hypothetical protein GCM10010988_34540 [Cnuibacter physcomitrellae]|nr:hypothetical protein GCM10010988_34540 [Cnuibacter physcomitrellae]